ncbi:MULTISPECIES: hypothetical protein [unclassified Neptuniibacter]|uniref:hypothetical protein n=1 Tax=unclassified Neptuniibacter TaxID=2630693 RepID=UPI000C5D7212|nr:MULTISPECIES: hypothetical protein [unclassified Neptuniibacter]MAY43509.1 hypothetical protein [Oceanospirillaceae bacterium]|tara:strand:- start:14675 stop:15940 length:1266 start_codon:yes stop_codon:yes gene_type:complete
MPKLPPKNNREGSEDTKYRIKFPKNNFGYLPPAEDFFELLNLKVSPFHLLSDIAAEADEKLPVGRNQLYNIVKDGISHKIKNKLLSYLSHVVPELTLNFKFSIGLFKKLYESNKFGANAGAWLSMLTGFNRSRSSDQLDLLVQFIEERSHAELGLCKQANRVRKQGLTGHEQALFISGFLSDHSLVPKEVLNDYCDQVARNDSGLEFDQLAVIKFLLFTWSDFYLSAIASYEIGTRNYMQRLGLVVEWDADTSIQKSMPDLLNEDTKRNSAFNNLLELTKALLGKGEEHSWREFSRMIPIHGQTEEKSDNYDSTSFTDKQYKTLRRWRAGKDLPSRKLLSQFISSFSDIETLEHQLLLERFTVVLAIDTWIRKWEEWLECHGIAADVRRELIQSVLNHYDAHLAQMKENHAEILEEDDKAA